MDVIKEQKIDLPAEVAAQLVDIFSSYPEVEKVIIFGSRALGNAKLGSDVDCAFIGKNLTFQLVSRIQNYLEEETLFPYFFDCVHLESTRNQELLEHIKIYGKILYEKKSMSD